jgi:hypothetical protein
MTSYHMDANKILKLPGTEDKISAAKDIARV